MATREDRKPVTIKIRYVAVVAISILCLENALYHHDAAKQRSRNILI
jgi:hypothetical protein